MLQWGKYTIVASTIPIPDTINTQTRSALARREITDLSEVARLDESGIKSPARMGIKGIMEIGRACLRAGLNPSWLKSVSWDYEYDCIKPDKGEFAMIAKGYTKDEYWMLERAICQLGPIAHAVSRTDDGSLCLWRSRKGYVDVEGGTEDESEC